MEIDRNLAVSLIDAFDSEDTAIVLWDKNDNVLYRNKKTSERWIKLKLDFEIGQNFYERLKKINDLNLLSKQELSLRKNQNRWGCYCSCGRFIFSRYFTCQVMCR